VGRVPPGSSSRRERYVPPPVTTTLSTGLLGFTNGLLLRIPKLYLAGDLDLLERPAIAIVGARKASPEGCRRAARLARELAHDGVVVMSGLAAGIDAAAHRAAIEHGGRTIAVTAMPLDRAYPVEHGELQREIYERHLLVSPFPSGVRVYPKDFPERNRVMARLAKATVVIEASDTSGSLHQVIESVDAGRPVFIAQSIVENASLTWPARFLGKTGLVHVLRTPQQVIDIALAP
jgi:DNA processing protein